MDIAKSPNRSFWRQRRRWLVAAAIGVVLLGVALLGSGRAAPRVARSDVWIDAATRGEMRREVRANGVLVPRQIRWITAGAPATVQQQRVEAGARVQAETPLLQLANPELEAGLDRARAALSGADADLAALHAALASQLLDQQALQAQAESELQIAQIKAKAYQRGHDGGAISVIDLTQSQIIEAQQRGRADIERKRVAAFRQNMAAQLRAAQARREQAASALAIATQQAESLQVRAGSDGILQQVDVEPGQRVEAGAKLARVARPDDLLARLQVPEVLAKDVIEGLPVAVDTHNGVVGGQVARIDPAVRSGSVAVDVRLTPPLPPGVRPDLSVDGRIVLGTLRDVVSIPRPALAVPNAAGSLFVLRDGGDTAQRIRVRFGAASSDRIEVRAGLRAGDRVVLSDTSQWNADATLRLR
ncbi:efflux RND transporter periplasmic adaptor subunit [uncultured Xanthomonas sp.]|uniref:efflux RND transporter periplasmic adaptor subunit n=1 Tax=uncultured Xanthomonas sp. TaxID=152831 RepID=UPI0025E8BED2|nr:efflux RND transporter periplasmic adaptor subunit [uncultured Xanthomonas sp.]